MLTEEERIAHIQAMRGMCTCEVGFLLNEYAYAKQLLNRLPDDVREKFGVTGIPHFDKNHRPLENTGAPAAKEREYKGYRPDARIEGIRGSEKL